MAQGIPFDKEEVLKALEPYFKLGYGIPKACQLAGFNDELIYIWIKKEPDLLVKIKAWQGMLDARAREVIAKSIIGDPKKDIEPDLDTAKWWAERKESKDFSIRQQSDLTTLGKPIKGITVEIIDKTDQVKKDK